MFSPCNCIGFLYHNAFRSERLYHHAFRNLMAGSAISEFDELIEGKKLPFYALLLETNKTPGNEGIPIEFYRKCWQLTSEPFTKCANECFEKSEISRSKSKQLLRSLRINGCLSSPWMNSPIPSLLLPLWQNESLCETIAMKIYVTCI